MKSIWREDCTLEHRPKLETSIETEVAVIGAGMAGMVTAYLLQKAGKQVVVLEQDTIGSGATGFTTGKITAQHGLCYHKLLTDFGKEQAKQYAMANLQAVDAYETIIRAEGISCDFLRKSAFAFGTEKEAIWEEYQACKELGLPVVFHENVDFFQGYAVEMKQQGQFHPLQFLKAIGKDLTVYEHTKVLEVEKQQMITTGGTVVAKEIVFACHFPFVNFPGMYFARMHQSRAYFLALQEMPKIEGIFIGAEPKGDSLRAYKDLAFFGGEDHRTGENSQGGCYERLRQKAQALFPNAKEVGAWSAQDCMTTDGVPYIGRFSKDTPHWYVATGFGKWGMSTSMVAGQMLRDMICGEENGFATVFCPDRFSLTELPELMEGGGQAVKGISRRIFRSPKTLGADLPLCHGGVVSVEGEKVGVYKDQAGVLYVVDIKCPHMGCQLEWNPDALSWDCPCHGSRFDYHGKVLSNPAQEEIGYE